LQFQLILYNFEFNMLSQGYIDNLFELDNFESRMSESLLKFKETFTNEQIIINIKHEYEYTIDKIHKEYLSNAMCQIYNSIESKTHECKQKCDQIITAYQSKLNNRNELLLRGRCNFVKSIIERIHENLLLNQSNIMAILEKYCEIKDNIFDKESAREIEDYLIEIANQMAMSSQQFTDALNQFDQENKSTAITSFKILLDNNDRSINDLFQFIFSTKHDHSLMVKIFELLKSKVSFLIVKILYSISNI
jgi:hypothetical protein